MKRTPPLFRLAALLASLAWLSSFAPAEDAKPAAEVPNPAAGAGQKQVPKLKLKAVPFQNEPLFIPELLEPPPPMEASAATTAAGPQVNAPPVVLLPGFPYIPLANPLAKVDSRPGYLGVQLDTAGDADAADDGAKKEGPKKIAGVGINSIVSDSPAEKSGLKEGDRVLTLEGKEAKNSAQLREMIRALKPDQDVKLTVRRDGKEMEIKAKLGAMPEQIAGVQLLNLNGNIVFGANIVGGNEPQAVPGVVTFRDNTARRANINGVVVAGKTGTAQRVSSSSRSGNVPTDTDTVTLRDGNRFTGKIRRMEPAKGLLLQRDGQPELELIEEEISALTFAERDKAGDGPKAASTTSLPKVVLQLRDGSILHGDSLTMEHDVLRLNLPGGQGTPAGQTIEIPREHAQSATLSDGESPQIFEGPTSMAGWSSGRYNQAQWEYKEGQLRCIGNGPIGRDLGLLPDPVDMSFDVNFPRQMQHIGVMLFSTNVSESGIGNLSVNFSPQQIYGNQYDGKRTNQYNANLNQKAPVEFSSKPELMRYRILVDRVKGSALIYINGVKQADWKLSKVRPEDLGKCGGAFSITPHASMSDVTFQLSNVHIVPWNGKEPAVGAEPPAAKGDRLLTSDGAAKNGAFDRITDGEILFAAPEQNTRRDRTVFLRFAEPAAPKESPAAVATAQLRNGSEISAAQVRGTGDLLTIATRCGPQITLPFSALRSLDYLPRAGQAEVALNNLDMLTFTDGTQLAGRALLPFADAKVGWKIAASKAPLEFPSEKIAGMLFRGSEGARKTTPLKGDSAIRLGNGDWLPGDVASLDGKRLVMKTDLAPEFAVPLSGLRAVYLNAETTATLADGATGPELWSEGWNPNRSSNARQSLDAAVKAERPWKYFDGGYAVLGIPRNGQQTVARHWPAYAGAYALNFESTTPSRMTYFNAQIFNSKDERTFSISASGTRMYVYYNPSYSRINRVGMGAPKQLQIETKNESGKASVSLIFDRPAKTFRIVVNGKEAGKIPFKEDEARDALDACGVALTTAYYNPVNGPRSSLDHIWCAPWNGPSAMTPNSAEKSGDKTAEKDSAPSSDDEPKPDSSPIIYLANGDDFPGVIEKISSDLVTVTSDAGPLEFPAKRVAWIHFPACSEPIADHYPRLRFHDRGLLSVDNLRIGGDRVQCKTLGGQMLDFPLSVVKEIVWRPIAEK